ncbi:hypothetical protein [Cypionkella sp.]|uniref:hypothetical protein n=1 Tax=Cypionkella sp. TaxID=2811411 RepID=UPI0027275A5F|nr:hypothetical protein [Cypionkella sp.]MDO8985339.1 hypothetical protein [Cypionkella sp.]
MCDLRKARETIETAGLDQPFLDVCLRVTGALEALDGDRGKFLPLSFFLTVVDDTNAKVALSALSYICTMECPPLAAHGYICDADEELIVLDDEDFLEVVKTGDLIHPRTGEFLQQARNRVHIFYSLLSL